MPNEEVHIGDDWYLGENDDGDLVAHNVRRDEDVVRVDSQETAYSTLEKVGFRKGDFVPLWWYTLDSSPSFTATSYTDVGTDQKQNFYKFLDVDRFTLAYIIIGQVNCGTDETVDIRLYDKYLTYGTLVEVTGLTGTNNYIMGGPEEDPRQDCPNNLNLALQVRESNGVNSSTLYGFAASMGVIL